MRLCFLSSTVTVAKVIFKRSFLVECTKYTYINAQWVKICQIRHFVFGFTSLPFLTVFLAAILTEGWWSRKLNFNPIPSNVCRYPHVKFQENRIKTVAVTVPSFFLQKIMTAVTSSIMLMIQNIDTHNQHLLMFFFVDIFLFIAC